MEMASVCTRITYSDGFHDEIRCSHDVLVKGL